MSVRVTSESEMIKRYFAPLAAAAPGAYGLLDDCASIHPPPGHDLVATTDALAETVHFLTNDDPADVAWKALAVNVSDLAGKGADPLCYLMSCAFPEAPAHAWLERFACGLQAAQDGFGITLVGGDTDRRPGPVTITITALGTVPAGCMVRRAGAEPGDKLVVSGTLGDAALGLKLRLEPDWAVARRLDTRAREHLLARALRPLPRVALAAALRAHARAAMDLSDGLVKDLGRLAAASHCGAVVEASMLPLSPAARAVLALDAAATADCLAGGEDYEILAAVPPAAVAAFSRVAAAAGTPVAVIGEIVAGSGVTVRDAAGSAMSLLCDGYDHF